MQAPDCFPLEASEALRNQAGCHSGLRSDGKALAGSTEDGDPMGTTERAPAGWSDVD